MKIITTRKIIYGSHDSLRDEQRKKGLTFTNYDANKTRNLQQKNNELNNLNTIESN